MHSGHLGGGMSTVEEEGVSGLPEPHLALLVDRVPLGCGEEGGGRVQQPDTVQWSGPWTAPSWPWMREAQMGRPYVFPASQPGPSSGCFLCSQLLGTSHPQNH